MRSPAPIRCQRVKMTEYVTQAPWCGCTTFAQKALLYTGQVEMLTVLDAGVSFGDTWLSG